MNQSIEATAEKGAAKLKGDNATPQELLNWRFQQGLYRAYYDAYQKARRPFSDALEDEAEEVLKTAPTIGSLEAIKRAEEIIDRPFSDPEALKWRARTYELAEALFQSARMQLSVQKYKAIREGRGTTQDTIDAPLFDHKDMKRDFMLIRMMDSEEARLSAIKEMD